MDFSKLALTGTCLMFVSNLPKDDPQIIFNVRVGFLIMTVIGFIVHLLVYLKIRSSKDKSVINVSPSDMTTPSPWTPAEYVSFM